jgi:hypothetical protein
MVVPFAAGNNADLIARTIAANYEKITNNQIVVENVPGGDTAIGVAHFKNNKKEILLGTATSEVFNPIVKTNLPYTDNDYETVIYIGTNIGLWITRADSDLNTPKDLLANMPPVVGGYVTSFNYNLQSFIKEKNVKSELVNYKGTNQLLIDIINGNIKLGIMSPNSTLLGMIKEKKVKVVGSAYPSNITLDGIYLPSVSQVIKIPQYNGYNTVAINPNLDVGEKEELKKYLWIAVQMSRPVFKQLLVVDDLTNDTAEISKKVNIYRKHVLKHTDNN